MKYFLLPFVFLFLTTAVSSANCSTGYACPLKELQEKQHSEFTQALNKFFERDIEEPDFFAPKKKISNYIDLFTFNKI